MTAELLPGMTAELLPGMTPELEPGYSPPSSSTALATVSSEQAMRHRAADAAMTGSFLNFM